MKQTILVFKPEIGSPITKMPTKTYGRSTVRQDSTKNLCVDAAFAQLWTVCMLGIHGAEAVLLSPGGYRRIAARIVRSEKNCHN